MFQDKNFMDEPESRGCDQIPPQTSQTYASSCDFCNTALPDNNLESTCNLCKIKDSPKKENIIMGNLCNLGSSTKAPTPERSPETPQDYFQMLNKSNHTHTTIQSKDKQSISTKCIKSSERIKTRTRTPATGTTTTPILTEDCCDDKRDVFKHRSTTLLNRPKEVNNLPRDRVKSVKKEDGITIEPNGKHKKMTKRSKKIRLPSPNASPIKRQLGIDEESSTSSTTCSSKAFNSIKVSPAKNHNNGSNKEEKQAQDEDVTVKNKSAESAKEPSSQLNQGWSVTVAGAGQHMEMDVEMRLIFPKNKASNNLMLTDKESPYFLEHKEETPSASYFDQRVLPTALNRYSSVGNSKRALTRVNTGICLYDFNLCITFIILF